MKIDIGGLAADLAKQKDLGVFWEYDEEDNEFAEPKTIVRAGLQFSRPELKGYCCERSGENLTYALREVKYQLERIILDLNSKVEILSSYLEIFNKHVTY